MSTPPPTPIPPPSSPTPPPPPPPPPPPDGEQMGDNGRLITVTHTTDDAGSIYVIESM